MSEEFKDLCDVCGIGFYLHLGDDARCDHCNSLRVPSPPSPVISEEARETASEENRHVWIGSPQPDFPSGHYVQLAITAATEKLTKENEELKRHLSSGICSAHQEPDPLNCSLCNQVVVLTNSNLSMMEKIETLSAESKQVNAIYESACAKALNERDALQSQLATARKALKFYSDQRDWMECSACGNVMSAKDGEPFMAFNKGEDHPWSIAQEALASITQPSATAQHPARNQSPAQSSEQPYPACATPS